MGLNLLHVTPIKIHPPSRGGEHRAHGVLVNFLEKGDTICRIAQGGEYSNYARLKLHECVEIEENYCEHRYLNPIYELARLPILAGYSYAYIGSALSLWPPSELSAKIDWADVIIVDSPYQASAVAKRVSDTPLVVVSHNVEAERLQSLSKSRIGQKFYNKTVALEQQATKHADLIACCSQRDVDKFKERYGDATEYIVVPNGTYEKHLKQNVGSVRETEIRRDIGLSNSDTVAVFIGSDYWPNVEAANSLIRLFRENSDSLNTELVVVGDVCESIGSVPENVHLLGFVEDLEGTLSIADMFLNPVVSGSGSNIKMFDYFAHGAPVITTPFGSRGIDVTDGKNVVISDISGFVDSINWVKENPERASELAENARQLALNNYTWNEISADFRERVQDLV